MAVLATVRNSGSHFALHLLEQYFCRHTLTEDVHGEPVLRFGHTEPSAVPLLRERLTDDGVMICTMRHPMEVCGSWIKRARPLDGWFRDMWRNLFALADEYGALWLPVDSVNREEYLQALSEAIGFEFFTDWTPRGVYSDRRDCQEGMSLDEARQWFRDEFGDRFQQFEYQI